ncbi:hypothetical protein PybrP1_010392 [[Pythium] brassicae (nom. inval.)]|nr:hypothetical protein PybrP1_010392 [[Pythium] brassicae (nom. inval.)]
MAARGLVACGGGGALRRGVHTRAPLLVARQIAAPSHMSRLLGSLRAKSDLVTLEKRGRVGVLRLNDPKRLNPMTAAMGEALQEKVAEVNARADEFGAAVLTGEGRAFSAGGDMKFLQERIEDTPTRNSVMMQQFYARYMSLRTLQVPLVAAINGPAIGAGLCISLFADVRVAAKDAKMGFTFVNLGLHPTANYLMLTGKIFDGVEAERLRLVSKAVKTQEVGLAAALLRESDSQAHSFATADYAEGLRALVEKRSPVFAAFERYSE